MKNQRQANWLFTGSLYAGQRAGAQAAIMSLIHLARLSGHDAYAYLKDILKRLPSQPTSRLRVLFLHRWSPAQ
jgi:transposase